MHKFSLTKCILTQDLGLRVMKQCFMLLKILSNTTLMLFRYHLVLQEQVL
ncbi:Uncharacterised protein [Mycobacterium tuberculosis]|nr:Uncharacterised protein [Streptococcus pneumoniae]CKV60155.1 Uncharacterised protein [Mycobacterium tuberculosis]